MLKGFDRVHMREAVVYFPFVGPVPLAHWVLFSPHKQCCGSGMFKPDPGSRVKKIPGPDPHQRI